MHCTFALIYGVFSFRNEIIVPRPSHSAGIVEFHGDHGVNIDRPYGRDGQNAFTRSREVKKHAARFRKDEHGESSIAWRGRG